MGQERRKFKRYKIPEVTGSLLFECTGQLVNVSLSGIAVECSQRLVVDRPYRFAIAFDDQRLDLAGRVIWCQGSEDSRYRAGLEFLDVWTPQAQQLLKLIQTKVLADLDTRLVRRFQSQSPGTVRLTSDYDFLVKCISLSGMEIETDLQPSLDEVYELEVSLRKSTLAVKGRIANVRQDGPRTGQLHQIGVEFEDLSDEDRAALESFIEHELSPHEG
jgi:hypothetical protein